MISKFRTTISISVFIITISSVYIFSNLPIKNATLWWGIYAFLVFLLIKSKSYVFDKLNDSKLITFKLFFIWNLISIIRGGFVASDYWEWKSLISTSMITLSSIVIYTATNPFMIQKTISLWLKYTLPAFLFLMPFIFPGAMGRYLFPISFIAIFFPVIPKKWKIITLISIAFVFVVGSSSRSNIIKFAVPLLISFLYYFNRVIAHQIIKIARNTFLLGPIIFLFLGVTGVFNVFNFGDYIKGDYTVQTKDKGHGDLKTDTRTGLYEEVLSSAVKHDYVWFGRTPARGNDSKLFGAEIAKRTKTKKKERYRNEACILNVFTWTGLLGVVLYFLVFLHASRLSIYNSNSFFIKIVGLYVSFRWLYAWVEDFRQFDLSSFFVWICLGMCFSKSFRSLTDKEIYYWVQGIFNKNYRIFFVKSQLLKKDKFYRIEKELIK